MSLIEPMDATTGLAGRRGRIRALDPHVVNKIAAGEVIERPASVVKELLENSLDALATRIVIEIENGGADLIRIADDGEGIHPDDVPLAITSHATSKIRTDDELFSVATMGFRGEALASIASVSRLRIRTRQPGAEIGHEMEVLAGDIESEGPAGCPEGTTIEIRGLFHNTPVRRRFLKTSATEFGHISEQFARVAIAHPNLHLVLRHSGKTVYELPATHSLLERLRVFHGRELTEKLIPVESEAESEAGPIRLSGCVAHPSQTKSTRKGQYLFLNGRYIQDRTLQHALSEAYRGLVMVGRHPITFLHVEMPPALVDVNVHPTKAEVRFKDGQSLYRQLLSMLRSKFLGLDLDSEFRLPTNRPAVSEDPAAMAARQQQAQQELVNWAQQEIAAWKPAERIGELPAAPADESDPVEPAPAPEVISSEETVAPEVDPVPTPSSGTNRALQVNDCYLVLETQDGLTVIDQHALHERILYEQFRQRVLDGAVEAQGLLVPEPVELDPAGVTAVMEHAEMLAELGFRVEEFGKGTILVQSYPSLFKRLNIEQFIKDIGERLQSTKSLDRREVIDSLLHMMACKAAIKSGQRLSAEEIDSLLALRHLVDDAHHCPHGRPTALVLSRDELDRQFGRLGA